MHRISLYKYKLSSKTSLLHKKKFLNIIQCLIIAIPTKKKNNNNNKKKVKIK